MRPDEPLADVSSGAQILDERAKGLARPFGSPGPEGDLHLIVRTGDRRIALPMGALRSVVPTPPITRLPSGDGSLLGLVTLGGEVVAVADLAALLGLDASEPDSDPLLLVVEDGNSQLALRVDAVEGQETLLPRLAARIDLSDSADRPVSSLTTSAGEDGLFVLDVDAVLADPRLSLLEAPRRAGTQGPQ